MTLPLMSKETTEKVRRMLDEDRAFKKPMRWGPRLRPGRATKPPREANSKSDSRYVPEPVKLDVNSIVVLEGHREIDKEAIDGLADSIQAIGLQHPITVRRAADGECVLIAGRHRLEAYRRLGLPRIPARIMEERWARLWSISENLHRVHQSQLDRADAIMIYAKERVLLEGGPRAQPGGRQPNDRGNSQTARALRMDRKQVRQARRHAEICEEAKKLLRLNGLDYSIKALNSVASRGTPEEQVTQARALIEERQVSDNKELHPKSLKIPRGGRLNGLATTTLLLELKRQWESLPFRQRFDNAPLKVRQRFIDEVLRPSG